MRFGVYKIYHPDLYHTVDAHAKCVTNKIQTVNESANHVRDFKVP